MPTRRPFSEVTPPSTTMAEFINREVSDELDDLTLTRKMSMSGLAQIRLDSLK